MSGGYGRAGTENLEKMDGAGAGGYEEDINEKLWWNDVKRDGEWRRKMEWCDPVIETE